MAEFEVKGITYKSTKLPLKPATRLLLKIGPLGMAGDKLAMAAALMEMPEEKIDQIIATCLGSCERKMVAGKGYAKIWNEPAHQPMFDDIGLMEIGGIVMAVLQDNFSNFLPGSALNS